MGPLTHCLCVRGESKVGVKSDLQELRLPAQCKVEPLPGDMRVCSGLVGVRGEEGTGGLGYGYSKPLLQFQRSGVEESGVLGKVAIAVKLPA